MIEKSCGLPAHGWSRPLPKQMHAFGIAASEALPQAMKHFDSQRVLLVTTRSLTGSEGLAQRIRGYIGNACVDVISDIQAHSPRADVIRLAHALSHVDTVVSIGGGSVCDTVKAARLCHANHVHDAEQMSQLLPAYGAHLAPPIVPYIAIPTTLSAGEYTAIAGVSNERSRQKDIFTHEGLAPDAVILDPTLTLHTPARLWLSTGIRAVDHAVETWCSINGTPLSDATSLHAFNLLTEALPRTGQAPNDLNARLNCQTGAWLAIHGISSGVDVGASHGIGHALGGVTGMPHGETSCVLLPHVLRWNQHSNVLQQERLARSTNGSTGTLADRIHALVRDLGLPQRLRDCKVSVDQLDAVAKAAIHDKWVLTNPAPLQGHADVMAILQSAW